MKRRNSFAKSIVVTIFLAAQIASAKSPTANLLLDAIKEGDRHELLAALEKEDANDVMKGLFTNLLDGRKVEAVGFASACVQGASEHNAIQTAVFCNQIRSNLLFARGDIPAWASSMQWTQALSRSIGREIGNGYDLIDYASLARMAPPIVTDLTNTRELQVIVGDSGPFTEIEINGSKVRALVDTGLTLSIIVSPRLASELELREIFSKLPLLPGEGSSPPKDGVTTATVKVGSSSFENLAVVIPERFASQEFAAVIGLPLLERIGRTRFIFGEAASPTDSCKPAEIVRSTAHNGMQTLLIPIKMAGRQHMALLDTGFLGTIKTTEQLDSPGPARQEMFQLGLGYQYATVRDITIDVEMLGASLGRVEGTQQESPDLPHPIMIGSRIKETGYLDINFESGKACMNQRNEH